MTHNRTHSKPEDSQAPPCGRLCVAMLLLFALGLSACDGKPGMRLELVSRVPMEGPATAVAYDATGQVVYVGAGDSVTGFIETSPGQWGAQPGGAVSLPGEPTAIEASAPMLYVALDGGVYGIDAQHSLDASYSGPFVVRGLQAQGGNVYAALNYHQGVYLCGLHALSASELAKVGAIDEPVAIGFVCTPETAFNDLAVALPWAYVVGDSVCGDQFAKAFLATMDLSQPSELAARGKVELPYLPANAIALAGDYAYVAGTGLYVIDVSDPDAPRQVTRMPMPKVLVDVVSSPPYVYVCDVAGRVQAIDITNPASPRAASAWFETGFAAHDLCLGETYLYVANDDGGLAVLRAATP